MFNTLTEVKAANKEAGFYFFSKGAKNHFNSKNESKLIAGKYFITSEQMGENMLRRYKVRVVLSSAKIKTISIHNSKEEAKAKIDELVKRNLHAIRDFKKIEIFGMRWFRKSYGTTYTGVKVYINGEFAGSNYHGGYDDQYKIMGFQILQTLGYYERTENQPSNGRDVDLDKFYSDFINNRDLFSFDVKDVPREKDVKSWLDYR